MWRAFRVITGAFGGAKRAMLAALVLRGVALGGRFIFVIFAARYMLPEDFGRFGLLMAVAVIVPAITGLESYQVLLRRILQDPARAPVTRQFYGTFALAGALISGAVSAIVLSAIGWSGVELVLGVVILVVEHLGLETFRNLINEQLPVLSVLSVAMRTGLWGVTIPALAFVGLISSPWPLETVLSFWLAGAVGGVLVGLPLWSKFWPRSRELSLRTSKALLAEIISRSWVWVTYNASWRVIETGGRFVCAWMISEAASGRFTLLSMLASLSYVAQKGVVEPVYFPRLSAVHVAEETHQEFRRVNLAVIGVGTLLSTVGLAASARLNGAVPPGSELVSFALLCGAFGLLSLSQPAHFLLYRNSKDRTIMASALAGCIVMLIVSILTTGSVGIAGTACGTMAGALVVFLWKVMSARRIAN